MSSSDAQAYLDTLVQRRKLQPHNGALVGTFTPAEYPHVLAAVDTLDGEVVYEERRKHHQYGVPPVLFWCMVRVPEPKRSH
jgi:hypothetical protein